MSERRKITKRPEGEFKHLDKYVNGLIDNKKQNPVNTQYNTNTRTEKKRSNSQNSSEKRRSAERRRAAASAEKKHKSLTRKVWSELERRRAAASAEKKHKSLTRKVLSELKRKRVAASAERRRVAASAKRRREAAYNPAIGGNAFIMKHVKPYTQNNNTNSQDNPAFKEHNGNTPINEYTPISEVD
jgi:hypothetical protein